MPVMKEDINVLKNGWLTDNVHPPNPPKKGASAGNPTYVSQIIAFWEECAPPFPCTLGRHKVSRWDQYQL